LVINTESIKRNIEKG